MIITAAHCCERADKVEDFSIYAGSTDLYEKNQVRSASQFSIFPKFNNVTLKNDICLVKLNDTLQESEVVQKIEVGVVGKFGTPCWIAGWGKTEVRIYEPPCIF